MSIGGLGHGNGGNDNSSILGVLVGSSQVGTWRVDVVQTISQNDHDFDNSRSTATREQLILGSNNTASDTSGSLVLGNHIHLVDE